MNKNILLLAIILMMFFCAPSIKFPYKQDESLGYRIHIADSTYLNELENFKKTIDQVLITMSENGSKFIPILSTNINNSPTYLLELFVDSISTISLPHQIRIFEMKDTILKLAKLENKFVKQANSYGSKSPDAQATESIVGTIVLNAIGLPFGIGGVYIAGNSMGDQIKPSMDLDFYQKEFILLSKMHFKASVTTIANDSIIFTKQYECTFAIDSLTNTSVQFEKLMREIFPNLISSKCPFFEEYQ